MAQTKGSQAVIANDPTSKAFWVTTTHQHICNLANDIKHFYN